VTNLRVSRTDLLPATGSAGRALLVGLAGVLLGVGAYTFHYAHGFSYLSSDRKACADCRMHCQRGGATKVFDHWLRSPLLNVNRACLTCHHQPEQEILARVDQIQQRNLELLRRCGAAIVALLDAVQAARAAGATDGQLEDALELQRKAQWRLDFIAAENSMGFHAPQEAAMVLGEAADHARQGELAAVRFAAPAPSQVAARYSAPAVAPALTSPWPEWPVDFRRGQ